jgi:hypothetical protein
MGDDKKRAFVLEIFAQHIQTGLDSAFDEKRLMLVRFIEGLWAKYSITLRDLRESRLTIETNLSKLLGSMRYA